ncbi:phage protease [Bartonella sp. CB60]|uniref:phage protease n=1 Tax=Bartonella sp. CB60 TaxID=3113619 RepID=UPI00300DF439
MEQEFHKDQEDHDAWLIDLCQDSSIKRAPEWVQILPKSPHVKARDGREWHYDPKIILEAFAANQGPLSIDYEHGQHYRARKGLEAPASGWIEKLAERDGAIWGHVKWTDAAAHKIITQEYRYLSPEFRHSKNGEILGLAGAGLVNRPALVMTALSSQQSLTTLTEKDMDFTAIASALSLAEDAMPDEILAVIAAREKERVELTSQLTDVQNRLALLQIEQKNTAIDRILDKAIEEGKILPAARAEYRALCAIEGGIEHFQALVDKLPVLVSTSSLETSALAQEQELAPEDIALAARHYQQEQAQRGCAITMSEAVDYICEHKESRS